MIEAEEWRPWRDGTYEVSDLGRVRRVLGPRRPHPVKTYYARGYEFFASMIGGVRKTALVHRVVIEAFAGPCPSGKEVNHIDGRKDNNCLTNLEYVTHSENMLHADRTGLRQMPIGDDHHMAIMRESDILPICARFSDGATLRELAVEYNVTMWAISDVVTCRSWQHVTREPIVHGSRSTRGERLPFARLTDDAVRRIRAQYATGASSYRSLGAKFNVAKSTIQAVCNGTTWRHVT